MSEENQVEKRNVLQKGNLEYALPKYPFTEMLIKDKNLKCIPDISKTFSTEKFPSFKELRAFPTPYIFAKLASKTYEDYDILRRNEYEQDLPEGWGLLTTATNRGLTNDYFGAAYCNFEKQQIVVSHRGTKLKKLGALLTDFNGVLLNKIAPQINSACTFADLIIDELNQLDKAKTNFQLFFTGHSLGGWLAQITTFTSKYLAIEANKFRVANKKGYHAHTVVFDSPGCRDMLYKMKDSFDLRYHNTLSVDILDITSYLSAPNIINTCNLHVGTLYRIFVDLSNLITIQKKKLKPTFYLKYTVTHKIKEILEAFDQTTGHVHKDNEGKLKIKEVSDWPLWHGGTDKELEHFFEWAKSFNDYEPEEKSVEFQNELRNKNDLYPIRYQVKNVDLNICSVNVFTEEELLFLDKYQHMNDISKILPDSSQNIEELLPYFKIEQKKIICRDEHELHKFINCVKNPLHLFPTIRDNNKRDYIINLLIESKSLYNYNSICNYFSSLTNTDVVETLITIHNTVSVLYVYEDIRLWLAKIYETFNNNENIVLLSLEEIPFFEKTMDHFVEHLANEKSLILFKYESNFNFEKSKIIITFFKLLKNYLKLPKKIKVVLVTRSNPPFELDDKIKSITCELNISCELKKVAPLTWLNLSNKFQEELLKRLLIVFQGQEKTSLNMLMTDKASRQFIDSNQNSEFLMHLINNENILVDSKAPKERGNFKHFYIKRDFIYQIEIEENIFRDKNNKSDSWAVIGIDKNTFSSLIPEDCKKYSPNEILDSKNNHDQENPFKIIKFIIFDEQVEQNFKELCQQYPSVNIHMLRQTKSESPDNNTLTWMKSQGSLSNLHKYKKTDENDTNVYTETRMLDITSQHKIIIISGTAGSGKSTVLTKMYKLIKQQTPCLWVFRINLNDNTKKLMEIKDRTPNLIEVIKFLSSNLLKPTPVNQTLFECYCQVQGNLSNMIVMFDGFDEVSPDYKKTVLDIVQILRDSEMKQIWITTRPNMKNDLENALQQFAFELKPLLQADQENLLTKFWNQTEAQDRVQLFAKTLIEKFANSINDTAYTFTGIPLQTRMLAEVFQNQCIQFCNYNEPEPILPESFKIFDLYERFFVKKHDIYQEEKKKVDKSKPGTNVAVLYEEFIESCQFMALHTMFNEEMSNDLLIQYLLQQFTLAEPEVTSLVSKELLQKAMSEKVPRKIKFFINNIKSGNENRGIVDQIIKDKPHFMHRTFAEFSVAMFIVNSLKQPSMLQLISETLLKHILVEKDYQVIRVFLNDQFESLPELWKSDDPSYYTNCCVITYRAICENNLSIIKLMINIIEKSSLKKDLSFDKTSFSRYKNEELYEYYSINKEEFYNECNSKIMIAIIKEYILKCTFELDTAGRYQYNREKYDLAALFFLKSHKLKQLISLNCFQLSMAYSFNNIGITYVKQGRYDQAIEYLKESKEINGKITDIAGVAVSLYNLGGAYWNKRNDKAIENYKSALILIFKLKIKSFISSFNYDDRCFNEILIEHIAKLKGVTENLLNIFAKRYSLKPDEIENQILPFRSKKLSKEDRTLIKNEVKLQYSTLNNLTELCSKKVELWFALAENDTDKVKKLEDYFYKLKDYIRPNVFTIFNNLFFDTAYENEKRKTTVCSEYVNMKENGINSNIVGDDDHFRFNFLLPITKV